MTHETDRSTNRHFLSGTNKHRYVSSNRFMDILGKQLWQTDKLANREHRAETCGETAATEVRFGRERVPEIENRPPYSPKNRQLARINIDTTISHRLCLLVFIVHFAKTIEAAWNCLPPTNCSAVTDRIHIHTNTFTSL